MHNDSDVTGQRFPSLTSTEFEELVLKSELTVVIYVTTDDCLLCDLMRKRLRAVTANLQHLVGFFEISADVEKALVSALDVKAVPTLLVFTSGIEVSALVGFYSADELQKCIWSIISTGDDE